MPNDAAYITAQADAVRNVARTHRGESPLQFHLRQWADELNQPESTDFHREDDSFNLCVLVNLLTDESTIGPVYTALVPLLRFIRDDLADQVAEDGNEMGDAAELRDALTRLYLLLDSRDTTVRETY